ncbi:MAG: triose-phosphate isomerase [Chromatiales bacterium 21-64-14]|nr:MAG: triose-phosphate isomerase [Chromatiales bacterium 21-64-14]HQU15434.1 triose-phosphate isomerase [Gammaproteobacteria bacterium]
MRRRLVAGNWKLNGTRAGIAALTGGIKAGLGSVGDTEVAVCPTFVHLPRVADLLQGTPVAWGAQDLCDQDEGAYTGEVSGPMLAELGCTYVIVGHSERRNLYGEDDAVVARKFVAARRAGLLPILCVGELLEEREAGVTEQVVARQLTAVLDLAGVGELAHGVIAYEPVWAIGTGKTASPAQAQEVHAFIRGTIAARDDTIAGRLRLLYGGSVKGSNAAELFAMPDIDGGLIGGASLKVEEFLAICAAAR